MIPHHMHPATRYSVAVLQTEVSCPGCWQTYVLGTGIVNEMYYTITENNEPKQRYGDVFFCSLACMLKSTRPDGAA